VSKPFKAESPKALANFSSDPLPFQFWHRYTSLTKDAVFVDVDYPQLMEKKRDRMLTNGLLRDALLKTKLRSSEPPVYLRSDQYIALGCDLRDLSALERTLRAELDVPSSSVLFIAEVSATYMPVADSDALIRWASTLEDGMYIDPARNNLGSHEQLASAYSSSICRRGQTIPLRRRCVPTSGNCKRQSMLLSVT
jgi:hypothetical protein